MIGLFLGLALLALWFGFLAWDHHQAWRAYAVEEMAREAVAVTLSEEAPHFEAQRAEARRLEAVQSELAEQLYDADPNCKHEVVAQWSGVKCKHCPGWFCL